MAQTSSIPARCCSEAIAPATNVGTSMGAATAAFRSTSGRTHVEDIASIAASRRRDPLHQPMLPASNRLTPLFAAIEVLRDCAEPLQAEELLIALVETVVAELNDGARSLPAPAG
jgi:hypothetical protein